MRVEGGWKKIEGIKIKLKERETRTYRRWRRFKISHDVPKLGLEVFQRKLEDICG